MKLALATLALATSALAQAPATTPPAKPATHHAAVPATASALPKVAGLPHTLYALKYIDIKIGTGPLPEQFRYYTVNYTGYLPDGTKFDSSVDPTFKHPTPFTFPYGGHRVITAWDTGFEGMRVGGKRRLFVPYQLAYGLAGSPPKIPAKSNLIFDVELVSYSEKPPTPPAPPAPRPSTPVTPPASAPATPPAATTPAPASAPTAPTTPPTQPPAAAPTTAPPPAKPASPPIK